MTETNTTKSEALGVYLVAKADEARHNRNVLQLGAAIAGLWGIVLGSNGLFTLADALSRIDNVSDNVSGEAPPSTIFEWVQLPTSLMWVMIVVTTVLGVSVVVFSIRRCVDQRRANQSLKELAEKNPDKFWDKFFQQADK